MGRALFFQFLRHHHITLLVCLTLWSPWHTLGNPENRAEARHRFPDIHTITVFQHGNVIIFRIQALNMRCCTLAGRLVAFKKSPISELLLYKCEHPGTIFGLGDSDHFHVWLVLCQDELKICSPLGSWNLGRRGWGSRSPGNQHFDGNSVLDQREGCWDPQSCSALGLLQKHPRSSL